MSQDPTTNTPETPSTQAAPAPQPATPSITPEIQAMIDAARVEGRNSGAAETRRALEAKIKPQPSAPAPQPAAPHAPQPTAPPPEYQALRSFERAMRRFDLTDEALAIVDEDFARANPTDPAGWVASRASAYGWRTLGTATPGTITTTPAPAPAPAPPMPGSTPPAKPVLTSDTPIMSLLHADPSQVARLSADIGAKKFVERLQAEWRATGLRVKR